jgi:RHS repeat-associated protein
VNMVMYQRGWRDGFYHRYSYDAENRLTLVETSTDSLVWEKEARYEYYRHGPLARVVLGHQQVQGMDYAYTLQGWLKGINSTGGTTKYDMGGDGDTASLNRYTAADAIGLTLNYFTGDYATISGHTPFPGYSAFMPVGAYRPLFNGNISSQSVYQKKFESSSPGGPLIFYNYKYDQLNRLVSQDAFNGFNRGNNNWNGLASMGEWLKERIAYDANGNILKYLRNSLGGSTHQMDSLNYHYYAGTNQLRRITDNVPANANTGYVPDIENQLDNNYRYDSIGNLISDNAEGITNIKWNVYGKIQEISRTATTALPATNIKYTYDALGNRISQVVTHSNGMKYYTWYVRDAQGNALSTYAAEGTVGYGQLRLFQQDRYIYGSSRLGSYSYQQLVDGVPPNTIDTFMRGYRQYELTNHLGNVLAVVSDKRIGVPFSGDLIDHYEPEIVSATDYYPFGMPSRLALGSGKAYRFGFNGKENDNDVKGYGSQQDYGMRIYDPRVGRFLSVDPLTRSYPMLTPYQFASNRPIDGIDLDGQEFLKTIPKFEYSGENNWVDYVSAIDNGVIGLVNLVPTTWNSIVATTQSLKRGTYIKDLTGEAKQAASAIKQTTKTFIKEPFKTLASPESVEFFTNAFVGAKVFTPGTNTGNLLNLERKIGSTEKVIEKTAVANSGRLTIPQGLTAEEFTTMSQMIRNKVGQLSDDIVVQGSRASGTASAASDIDIAIKMSAKDFSQFLLKQFKKPNPGSAAEKTMFHAIETGKIQAGEAGLSGFRKELEKLLGMQVDISVIKTAGKFDNGVQLPIEK